MEVRIQAIHFDITDRLTEFINKKADRLVRHYPNIDYIETLLKVIKPETSMNKEVVIKAIVPGQGEQTATKVADSFEEAIDIALEALDHQLERIKSKK